MRIPRTGRLWRISGDDEMAYNEPGKEPKVKIQEIDGAQFMSRLTVPPISISLFELELKK
jgi:hypothetical protein